MNYPVTVAIAALLALGYDWFGVRTRLVGRRAFWTAYAIVLGFQLVVNGILTGLPVVRYASAHILGWRVMYAPVEDIAFGFAMTLFTLATWVRLGRSGARGGRAATRSRQRPADAADPR